MLMDIATLDETIYENISGHVVGVIKLREHDGKPNAIGVRAGERIGLNEVEQRLTRNAPKNAADNPFANGDLTAVVEDRTEDEPVTPVEETPPPVEPPAPSQDGAPDPGLPTGALPAAQSVPAPPERVQEDPPEVETEEVAVAGGGPDDEETGTAAEPVGPPPEGEYAQDEEVATPDAPAKVAEETGKAAPRSGKNRKK